MSKRRYPVRAPSALRRGRKVWYAATGIAFFLVLALLRPYIAPLLGELDAETVYVRHVIDGDTIVLGDGVRVRYIGIDTPEMDAAGELSRRLAREARDLNVALVDRRNVRLTFDRDRRDKYGRTLAYVWAGDDHSIFVNARLVEAGLARAQTYGANDFHAAELSRLEAQARAARRGIWAGRDR